MNGTVSQAFPYLQGYGSARSSGAGPVQTVFLVTATLLMVALTVLAVVLILRFVQGIQRGRRQPAPGPARLAEILNERLARGELTAAEYEKLRQELLGRTPPPFS